MKDVHMKQRWLTCYFQEAILQNLRQHNSNKRHLRNKIEDVY